MTHRFLFDPGMTFSERTERNVDKMATRRRNRFFRALTPWLLVFGVIVVRMAWLRWL